MDQNSLASGENPSANDAPINVHIYCTVAPRGSEPGRKNSFLNAATPYEHQTEFPLNPSESNISSRSLSVSVNEPFMVHSHLRLSQQLCEP